MVAIMLGAASLFALALAFAAAWRANYGPAAAFALPGLVSATGNFYAHLDGPYLGKACLLACAEAALVITVGLGACAYLEIGVTYVTEPGPEHGQKSPTGGPRYETPPNPPYQPITNSSTADTPTERVLDHPTTWRARHGAI